jgi:hypothetical protein
LLVDGADQSKYNPDFEWSRHLPSAVELDRWEHDKYDVKVAVVIDADACSPRLLDLLFKFYTPWCLRIVPARFLRDMYHAIRLPTSQTPPKIAHYSPMLHNALLALATAFSDNSRLRNIKSRLIFLEKAKSYIDTECITPNISVVHGLAMIGNFYCSMGQLGLGYVYFGKSPVCVQLLI